MSKRRFRIEFTGGAMIELDDAVMDTVTDEWRSVFSNLHTVEDIAEYIGYNLVINNAHLSMLDGWADQPDDNAIVIEWPDWDICLTKEECSDN